MPEYLGWPDDSADDVGCEKQRDDEGAHIHTIQYMSSPEIRNLSDVLSFQILQIKKQPAWLLLQESWDSLTRFLSAVFLPLLDGYRTLRNNFCGG